MIAKILIVDSSAADRALIGNMLSDYDILTARDGLEAMQLLNEHQDINLMILDLNMPNMTGFQVLEATKADSRLGRLRTIILTNYDERDNQIKGLRLGAVDYISKPLHIDSLRARIDVHVELLGAQYIMEQRFHDQAATLDTILAQMPLGIAVSFCQRPISADLNEHFSVNQAFEELTGRTEAELLAIGWAAITHPDDIEEELRHYQRLQAGETNSFAVDKRFIRPDGSIVWVHLIVASLVLSENHQLNHVALARNITERRAIEEMLTESERSKSVLLSHLQGMAYRCNYDRDWTMQFVSSGCLELTGYAPESLLYNRDLSFNDLITPEYRESLWREWHQVVAAKTPLRREYEITTAHGVRKWVFEIGQGVYNHRGEVEALEGIIIDISERKDMEDQLRYANEHDAWTGLYNRRYLEPVLMRDCKMVATEKAALVTLNLSAMHALSITYGFQYGQDLIRRVADELRFRCADHCMLFSTNEYRFVLYKKGYKDHDDLLAFCNDIFKTLTPFLSTDRVNFGIGVIEVDEENKCDVELLLQQLLITSEEAVLGELPPLKI